MDLSSAIKSPLVLSGIGAVAIGGVGITVGQVTIDKGTSNEDYPSKKDIFQIQKDEEEVIFDPKSEDPLPRDKYGCFQNFFPGVEAKNKHLDRAGSIVDSLGYYQPATWDSYRKPIGCAFMRHSYIAKHQISFEAAVTIKTDGVGWFLGASGSGYREGEVSILYRLILLTNRGNTGMINGGYSGVERESGKYLSLSNRIAQDQNGIKTPSEEDPTPSSRYFGIGMSSGIRQTILGNISKDMYDYSHSLGYRRTIERFSKTYYPVDQSGTTIVQHVYDPYANSWIYYGKKVELTHILRTGYAPFIMTKGWGVSFNKGEFICKKNNYSEDEGKFGIEFVKQVKSMCSNV